MFALKWDDVDFTSGTIYFHNVVRSGKVKSGTKVGDRGFADAAAILPLLRMLRDERPADASPVIFQTLTGKMMTKGSFSKRYSTAMRSRLNLPLNDTLYSLKHLGDSFLAANGVEASARANQMGHTTDRMARNTYRFAVASETGAISRAMDAFIGQSGVVKGANEG